jgi:hypothetical protein
MILILTMYISQTVRVALDWYGGWLTYVKYSGSNDQALATIIISEESPLILIDTFAVENLFITVSLGIADSIMVLHLTFCRANNSSR